MGLFVKVDVDDPVTMFMKRIYGIFPDEMPTVRIGVSAEGL